MCSLYETGSDKRFDTPPTDMGVEDLVATFYSMSVGYAEEKEEMGMLEQA